MRRLRVEAAIASTNPDYQGERFTEECLAAIPKDTAFLVTRNFDPTTVLGTGKVIGVKKGTKDSKYLWVQADITDDLPIGQSLIELLEAEKKMKVKERKTRFVISGKIVKTEKEGDSRIITEVQMGDVGFTRNPVDTTLPPIKIIGKTGKPDSKTESEE